MTRMQSAGLVARSPFPCCVDAWLMSSAGQRSTSAEHHLTLPRREAIIWQRGALTAWAFSPAHSPISFPVEHLLPLMVVAGAAFVLALIEPALTVCLMVPTRTVSLTGEHSELPFPSEL